MKGKTGNFIIDCFFNARRRSNVLRLIRANWDLTGNHLSTALSQIVVRTFDGRAFNVETVLSYRANIRKKFHFRNRYLSGQWLRPFSPFFRLDPTDLISWSSFALETESFSMESVFKNRKKNRPV